MKTAFPETESHVASLVRDASVDHTSLTQPLNRCDLSRCAGTCCHDGVYLGSDEANTIRSLAEDHAPFFSDLGLDLPARPIVYGKSPSGSRGPKTATRPEPMSRLADNYPPHFADTQCVFMLADRRCSLQLLSGSEGHHPWFYKPFTCWMHPLSLHSDASGKPRLTLHNRDNDPQNLPGYPGFASLTHCGAICQNEPAPPAHETLAPELAFLESISGHPIINKFQQ